ncbi:MAG: imidazole glycerol phosphate synthase subunit HisH [Planctomycetes bacterium]|nr:imidazole glycerol phosphate synthase subunit HisH [Planctomycetota bacterium]
MSWIAIIDYGMGNLRSVQKALQRAGGDARIIASPAGLAGAEKIVLPGVGAFRDAIGRLRSAGFDKPLIQAASGGAPFLGICLGLQLLFDVSFEDGRHAGLGIIPGQVVRFDFSSLVGQRLAVPHMGWNRISWNGSCPFLAGLEDGQYVYFCHSYYVVPRDEPVVCTKTEYGLNFTSSICRGNLFATQFHPEKSQSAGLQIMRNFVGL